MCTILDIVKDDGVEEIMDLQDSVEVSLDRTDTETVGQRPMFAACTYVDFQTVRRGHFCPECGELMVFQSACHFCPICGYSPCD